MFLMLCFRLGVNQNIVDEDHNKLIHVLHKHLIHEVHEIGWGIHKSEGHHGILIESILVVEHCLGNI
jgi:RNA binding exosome subunit